MVCHSWVLWWVSHNEYDLHIYLILFSSKLQHLSVAVLMPLQLYCPKMKAYVYVCSSSTADRNIRGMISLIWSSQNAGSRDLRQIDQMINYFYFLSYKVGYINKKHWKYVFIGSQRNIKYSFPSSLKCWQTNIRLVWVTKVRNLSFKSQTHYCFSGRNMSIFFS